MVESSLQGKSLEEIGNGFVEALYSVDNGKEAFINSAEFFMSKTSTAIYNSEGVDVSYEKNSVSGEFIVQCIIGESECIAQRINSTDNISHSVICKSGF